MELLLLAGLLPAVCTGIVVLGAARRLFARAPGWPQRTFCLVGALTVLWTLAPAASALCLWLTGQLPYVLLGLVALTMLWPRRRF